MRASYRSAQSPLAENSSKQGSTMDRGGSATKAATAQCTQELETALLAMTLTTNWIAKHTVQAEQDVENEKTKLDLQHKFCQEELCGFIEDRACQDLNTSRLAFGEVRAENYADVVKAFIDRLVPPDFRVDGECTEQKPQQNSSSTLEDALLATVAKAQSYSDRLDKANHELEIEKETQNLLQAHRRKHCKLFDKELRDLFPDQNLEDMEVEISAWSFNCTLNEIRNKFEEDWTEQRAKQMNTANEPGSAHA